MNIKRNDIDKQKIGFSDIASGRRLPPVHPGEILGRVPQADGHQRVRTGQCHQGTPYACQRYRPSPAERSRSTPRFASGDTSAHRLSSGSIFRRATISTSPTARYDVASKRKFHPERFDRIGPRAWPVASAEAADFA